MPGPSSSRSKNDDDISFAEQSAERGEKADAPKPSRPTSEKRKSVDKGKHSQSQPDIPYQRPMMFQDMLHAETFHEPRIPLDLGAPRLVDDDVEDVYKNQHQHVQILLEGWKDLSR